MKPRAVTMVLVSTWAPLVALISSALSQAILFGERGMPWRGEFFWTVEWIEGNCFPALIATAVAVSIDGVRVIAPDRRNQVVSGDLRRPFLITYFVIVALAFAVPYAGALGVGMTMWPDVFTSSAAWALLHAGVALLSVMAIFVVVLAIAVAVGTPALALGPMVAVGLGYVAMGKDGLILIGASTGSLLGFEPVPRTLALQFIAAIAVIVGLGYLIVRWPERSETEHRRWRPAAVLGVAAALGISGSLGLDAYAPTQRGVLECLRSERDVIARTCVSYEHARLLGPLHNRAREAAQAAAQFGIGESIPTVTLEAFTRTREGLDSIQDVPKDESAVAYWRPSVEELANPNAEVTRESFAEALATPSHCPQMSAEEAPSQEFWEEVDARASALQVLMDETAPETERAAAAQRWSERSNEIAACDFR